MCHSRSYKYTAILSDFLKFIMKLKGEDFNVALLTGLLFLVPLCNGQEYTFGTRTEASRSVLGRNGPTEAEMTAACSPAKMGPVCFQNILLTCIAGNVFRKYDCKAEDPTKPYCEKSSCTNMKPIAQTDTTQFHCTSVGLFPDPHDCTRYYQCAATGQYSSAEIQYNCKNNYVYDSKTGMCKIKRSPADCRTINCEKKRNTYQLYTNDKSILAFCADSGETILFRCPNYYYMEYDPITFECTYGCTKEGYFEDTQSKNMYYACYKTGTHFVSEHMKCLAGLEFDADRQACLMTSGPVGNPAVTTGIITAADNGQTT